MKRKLILLVVLSFIFVYTGALFDQVYDSDMLYAAQATPEADETASSDPTDSPSPAPTKPPTPRPTKSPTPRPSRTPRPIRTTPKPTASPTPTLEPTPTPSPVPTEEPTPTVSPIPTPDDSTPDPNATPVPEKPMLPNIAIPDLEYPATEPPENTPDPNTTDELEPTPSPSPSPSPSPLPEPKDIPTWSGLVKFIARVFYVAAVLTAIYSLFFFLVCVLFKKQPDMTFWIFKKKKKEIHTKKTGKPKNTAVKETENTAEHRPQEGPSEFDREASAYFSGGNLLSSESAEEPSEESEAVSEGPPSQEQPEEILPAEDVQQAAYTETTGEASQEEFAEEPLTDISELENEEEQVMPGETVEPDEIKLTPADHHKPIHFMRAVERDEEPYDQESSDQES